MQCCWLIRDVMCMVSQVMVARWEWSWNELGAGVINFGLQHFSPSSAQRIVNFVWRHFGIPIYTFTHVHFVVDCIYLPLKLLYTVFTLNELQSTLWNSAIWQKHLWWISLQYDDRQNILNNNIMWLKPT